MISENEFKEWLLMPATKELIRILNARREDLRQQWEGGSFTDYEKDGTVLTNVGNMGTCKGYAFVTDFTYEQYLTEIGAEDGEQVRAQAPGGSGVD